MKKFKYFNDVQTIFFVVVATALQTFAINAIVTHANLLPAGFMGLSVLVQGLTKFVVPGGIPLNISVLLLNLPVALICYKGLNKKFAIYSIFQVILSSIFLGIFKFPPLIDDTMLAVVLGGALSGLYVTLALLGNASTGGTDFIALYVSNKKQRSIWEYVFVGNVIMILIFGFTSNWEAAGYSLLYQFISTKTIEAFYHRYDRLTIQITTSNPEKVMDYYFANHKHGMTCMEAVGGYTHRKVYLLYTVVSSYEVKSVTRGVLATDPAAIINVMKTQQFHGSFHRDPQF